MILNLTFHESTIFMKKNKINLEPQTALNLTLIYSNCKKSDVFIIYTLIGRMIHIRIRAFNLYNNNLKEL